MKRLSSHCMYQSFVTLFCHLYRQVGHQRVTLALQIRRQFTSGSRPLTKTHAYFFYGLLAFLIRLQGVVGAMLWFDELGVSHQHRAKILAQSAPVIYMAALVIALPVVG